MNLHIKNCSEKLCTVHVPSDTLRTWKWSPTPKGTCPLEHLEDLEVAPTPKDIIHINNDMNINNHIDTNMSIDIRIIINMNIEDSTAYYVE